MSFTGAATVGPAFYELHIIIDNIYDIYLLRHKDMVFVLLLCIIAITEGPVSVTALVGTNHGPVVDHPDIHVCSWDNC